MGSNDGLPPPQPPEPGRVPPPPPAPPAVPRFEHDPQSDAPTAAMPAVPPGAAAAPRPEPDQAATIPMPAVRPAAPHVAPRPPSLRGPMPPAVAPGAAPRRSSTAWVVVGAAVAVVAVVLALVFALSGEDDTVTSSPTTIVPPLTADSTVPATEPVTTPPRIDTTAAVTTVPATTAPVTAAPTTVPLEPVVVADGSGVFTVLLLDTFRTDTAPAVEFGGTFPSVIGSEDLTAFTDPNNRSQFGVQVVMGLVDQMPTPADAVAQLDPGPSACADRSVNPAYPIQFGAATLQLLDFCGADQQSAQVDMAFTLQGYTVVVHAKGAGPASTDLVDFVQAVAESIVIL